MKVQVNTPTKSSTSFTKVAQTIIVKVTVLVSVIALTLSGASLAGYLYIPHMLSMVLGYGLILTALVMIIKNLK